MPGFGNRDERKVMDLHNRTALVTGGAQRLGRAIALALADAGVHVMIHYYGSEEQARATVADIRARGVRAESVQGDLTSITDAERVVDTTLQHWGGLDLLVCNAGIWGSTPLGSATEAQWERLYALNARAPFFMAQRAADALRAAQGSLVAICDVGITTAWKNYTPYLSSKAALAMVVQNLAKELAPEVRVNGVSPGPVLLPEDWSDEQREKTARSTLLRRVGRAEDIAGAVCFLAQADYVTGVILPVDGGQRLK
jgi:pteridine reductase